MNVRAVRRPLSLLLQRLQQLLGIGRRHHPHQHSSKRAIRQNRLGRQDVGEAGPPPEVEVASRNIDGVEVAQRVPQRVAQSTVIGEVVERSLQVVDAAAVEQGRASNVRVKNLLIPRRGAGGTMTANESRGWTDSKLELLKIQLLDLVAEKTVDGRIPAVQTYAADLTDDRA